MDRSSWDGLEGLAAPRIADNKESRPLIDEDSLAMGIRNGYARLEVVKREKAGRFEGSSLSESINCYLMGPIISRHYRPEAWLYGGNKRNLDESERTVQSTYLSQRLPDIYSRIAGSMQVQRQLELGVHLFTG